MRCRQRFTVSFYRAMHFSANRGIAIACRLSVSPSVCLSVCNVGGSGSHRTEILETNCTDIRPTRSLFGAQRPSTICYKIMLQI